MTTMTITVNPGETITIQSRTVYGPFFEMGETFLSNVPCPPAILEGFYGTKLKKLLLPAPRPIPRSFAGIVEQPAFGVTLKENRVTNGRVATIPLPKDVVQSKKNDILAAVELLCQGKPDNYYVSVRDIADFIETPADRKHVSRRLALLHENNKVKGIPISVGTYRKRWAYRPA